MNLNQLAIFHAVAKENSVSRGAERLHISQPAVSKQLREFEKSLGVALFHRLSSGVRLTEAGELLRDYATRIFGLETEAEHALDELRVLDRGRLVVGASSTIGTYLLPQVCSQFGQQYPKIELHLEIANTEEVQRRLIANSVDVALTEGLVLFPEIETDAFAFDEIVLVAAPNHVLLENPSVEIGELLQYPLILRERGSGTRAVVQEAFAARGIFLQPSMSLGSTVAILRAVAANVGIAWVSRLAIENELQQGALKIVAVNDFKIIRALQRLKLKGKYESRAAREFVRMLRSSSTR